MPRTYSTSHRTDCEPLQQLWWPWPVVVDNVLKCCVAICPDTDNDLWWRDIRLYFTQFIHFATFFNFRHFNIICDHLRIVTERIQICAAWIFQSIYFFPFLFLFLALSRLLSLLLFALLDFRFCGMAWFGPCLAMFAQQKCSDLNLIQFAVDIWTWTWTEALTRSMTVCLGTCVDPLALVLLWART